MTNLGARTAAAIGHVLCHWSVGVYPPGGTPGYPLGIPPPIGVAGVCARRPEIMKARTFERTLLQLGVFQSGPDFLCETCFRVARGLGRLAFLKLLTHS